jgi:hypothetical protein
VVPRLDVSGVKVRYLTEDLATEKLYALLRIRGMADEVFQSAAVFVRDSTTCFKLLELKPNKKFGLSAFNQVTGSDVTQNS